MFFIVVGCGRVGAELSYRLYRRGHQVAVVDQVGASFRNLNPEYRGRTVEGEVLSEDVLRLTGIEQADGLAAVTNSDPVNAVVAHLARAVYDVPNVVVRNYDPRWRSLHETFHLQSVGSTAWGAERIEELLYSAQGRTVFSAGNGEVEVYELLVPENWVGRTLGELATGAECVVVAHTRAGKAALPGPELRLEEGDLIHVSATQAGVEALRERLLAKREA